MEPATDLPHARLGSTVARPLRRVLHWSASPIADLVSGGPTGHRRSDGPGGRSRRSKNSGPDAFHRGSTISVARPGVLTGCGPALLEPVGRIHLCSDVWTGFIAGAIRTIIQAFT